MQPPADVGICRAIGFVIPLRRGPALRIHGARRQTLDQVEGGAGRSAAHTYSLETGGSAIPRLKRKST